MSYAIIDERDDWYAITEDKDFALPKGHKLIPKDEAMALSRRQEVQEQLEQETNPERHDFSKSIKNAIESIDTFLALATPTNAQTLAMVKELARQNKRILRRMIQIQ